MILLRFLRIVLVCGWHFVHAMPDLWVLKRGNRDSHALPKLGRHLANLFEALGPTYIKVGQTLANRPDLAPEDLLQPLRRLQDNVRPFSKKAVERILKTSFNSDLTKVFKHIEPEPIAAGSIAQVHRARLKEEDLDLALKIRRPRVQQIIDADLRLLRLAARLLILFPQFRETPLPDLIDELGHTIRRQTDFKREVRSGIRFLQDLADVPGVTVPRPLADLCSEDVIVMMYCEDLRRLDDPGISQAQRRHVLKVGLNSLYRMIFRTGFIHCDLHPGNLLVAPDGRLVILDHGLVAEFDDTRRAKFLDFFLGMIYNDGRQCARIMQQTAIDLRNGFNASHFMTDVCELIARVSTRCANEFQVSEFAIELFDIQRRHGLRGSTDFTMAILALLMFEGLAKQFYPTLDFQRQAVPFVATALTRRAGVRV